MASASEALPLAGLCVLDFSTLLPGPLAGLLLAEAGARVVKVERPPAGDEMRDYVPAFGAASANFALLNRGKSSLCIDLKDPAQRRELIPLLETADVLLEQFRPGVMARLGLGFDEVRAINPRLVYCSITGYGQHGERAARAGHDLNYLAETGLLGLTRGADGAPVLPPMLAADIAGGAYPAVMNILLALRQRDTSGRGCHIDVAMSDNLFTFAYWGLASGFATGQWPRPGAELVTGGSPRYAIYRTADARFVAAAPLEDRFWATFCDAIGLPADRRDDARDPEGVRAAVAERIAARTAAQWQQALSGVDACASVVASLQEAVADPAFAQRGLFEREVADGGAGIPALPLPIAAGLRDARRSKPCPELGEHCAQARWQTGDPQ